ncbi:hypothetical protein [Sodalis ligni]|uniref:Uncharacterized protein n=1 Tax=Sodalis ligni TaxID=2697027 RepID=A0A4R1NIU1_9GAMM|nr:hypothetical protein [Sodalis ligni]TCL04666.1 hypothetical protein EZJ58_2797 [Sodalis ligni]
MANIITVIATPNRYPYNTATSVAVVATVVDASTGAPAQGVPVTFTFTSAAPLNNIPPTVTEDTGPSGSTGPTAVEFNIAATPVSYVLQVRATIDGSSAVVYVAAYNPGSAQVYVSNAGDNIIDQYDINDKIQALVPAAISLAPFQTYTFYWGGQARERLTTTNAGGQVIGVPWVVDVTEDFPRSSVLSDGNYEVFYEARDPSGNSVVSTPRTITVQGSDASPATLAAPQLLPANLNNRINLLAAYYNPSLLIPPQAALTGGTYEVTLVATSRSPVAPGTITRVIATGPVPVNAATAGIPVPMTYLSGVLLNIDDSTGDFYYTISRPGLPILTSLHLITEIDTVAPTAAIEDEDEDEDEDEGHHHPGHGHGHGHDHRPH